MKIRCEYCRSFISDTDEFCPNCLAPNSNLKRVSTGVPKTIEELKQWYIDHNLPNEEITRFFIGKDIKEPKAFGIYLDENSKNYVVYKNKSDGTRSIRYEGQDQSYAVNELYTRLKEEIASQKSNQPVKDYSHFTPKRRHNLGCLPVLLVYGIIFLILFISAAIEVLTNYNQGYYIYQNEAYYLPDKCTTHNKKACNWYKYDQETDYWYKAEETKIKPLDRIGTRWYTEYNNIVKFDTDIYLSKGYYVYNNEAYYAYERCPLFATDTCEWYKYDQNANSWSIVNTPDKINNKNFIETYWDYSGNPYKDTINIQKDYTKEDWYKKLHPPEKERNYYIYNNNTYYYYRNQWYIYNNGWQATDVNDDLNNNYVDYYESDYNVYSSNIDELFTDSSYYNTSYDHDSDSSSSDRWHSDNDYDNDWDSDSSWDSSDSWDSGGTDFDSDW